MLYIFLGYCEILVVALETSYMRNELVNQVSILVLRFPLVLGHRHDLTNLNFKFMWSRDGV